MTVRAFNMAQNFDRWIDFFSKCMRERVDFPVFLNQTRELFHNAPLDGRSIFRAWARQRNTGKKIRDRLLVYFEQLLQGRWFTDADVLYGAIELLKENATIYHQYAASNSSEEWKQTTEAAVLERLAYQMEHFRDLMVDPTDRLPDIRMCKPLNMFLASFTKIMEGTNTFLGPASEIATATTKLIIVYINNLSKLGILTCSDGGPPKGRSGSNSLRGRPTWSLTV